jgi:isoquinoline 1-oxidoreductase beta subunit
MSDLTAHVLSRRSFLLTSGGFAVAVAFGARPEQARSAGPFKPNAWVTIGEDDIITIMSPACEMGQGIMTTLPLLIAEDLDADWSKVRVVQSPDDAKVYGNPGFNGVLTTVASAATRGYYEKMRLTGAQTRKVLLANAAEMWNVPVGELGTEPGVVVHAKSGRRIRYGEIAKNAKVPDPLPETSKADFKPLAQCRYIGRDVPRIDIAAKVDGSAVYGSDITLPNTLYASVLHPPVQSEMPEQIDDSAAKAIKGIVAIVPLPTGVGVVGETLEATMKAKAALKVEWSNTAQPRAYTSAKILEDYRAIAADSGQKGVEMVKKGDATAAFAGAARVVAADFLADHVAHVCMEPMCATAVVTGDAAELWASNQSPTEIKELCAHALHTVEEKVKVNTPLLGGGFGRRTDGEEVVEAVLLAKAMPGRPIKVVWSREDDIRNDKWRPLSAQRIEVALDASGAIVGWRHRVVAESYLARALPGVFQKIGGRDLVSAGGGDFKYAVPAHLVEYVRARRGFEVGAWRGVGPGYTKFAVETVIDEVAALKGVDPVAFRLDLLKHEPRAAAVVQAVAQMSDWGRARDGRGLGIAYSDALGSHTAAVVEVSLDRASGEIKPHNVWVAVDAGIAVQPKNIVAQIEGAAIFGLGAALYEQINVENGEVKESNLNDYRVQRMSDVPPIEVKVISTDNPPTGIGEAGVAPIAPAIANAVARLTDGKRLRQLPMLPERVKKALA